MSSSGLSNVGSGSLYEAGDQRNAPQTVYDERAKFEQGQHRSHKNLDSSMSLVSSAYWCLDGC